MSSLPTREQVANLAELARRESIRLGLKAWMAAADAQGAYYWLRNLDLEMQMHDEERIS